jgi:anti-sigma regulatory factor (Ser/Thr protein kinase)
VATGVARTATGISVSIARDAALVRTVRLIAAAVARRTGQDEEFVEEVRLAVGEACALMVGTDSAPQLRGGGPITVRLRLDDRLVVDVESEGEVVVDDDPDSDVDGVEPWALLRGLIEDFSISRDGARTTLSMSWPMG